MKPILFSHLSPAVRRLCWYNLFVSFTLTIAANFTFLDRLLMRLGIDLGLFGTVKSVTFLMPAVVYQLASPLVRKLDRDAELCAVCYTLRGVLPLLLPVLAIFCTNKPILTAASTILPAAGMLCAVFANNSLMILYRKVIPAPQFNYSTGLMNMLLSLPSLVLALPIAWLLDRCDHWDDPHFFLLFASLHLFTVLFDIPAVMMLWKLTVPRSKDAAPERRRSASPLAPYRDRTFRLLLLMIFLHRVGGGLAMAYLTVYFLKVVGMSMTMLTFIGLTMSILLYTCFPFGGRIMDKWGYGKVFPVLSFGMLAGMTLFCLFWRAEWVLPFFALLTWDAIGSIGGGVLFQGEYAAAGKLAEPAWLDAAVAAFSICSNGGVFTGLLAASGLYWLAGHFCGGDLSATLRFYHAATIPLFAAIFALTLRFRARRVA